MEISSHDERGGGGGGNKGAATAAAFMCRPSSSRWIPTTEQIRILRDLYYNGGLRSPTTEQIQRISAKLRQFGKIEGKNVFYWFQNHKARERQKKRIINELSNSNDIKSCSSTNLASGGYGATTAAIYGHEQMGSSGYGGGSTVLMERSFRESFVVGGGDAGDHLVQCMEGNMALMDGFQQDPAASPWMTMYQSSWYPHEQGRCKQKETLQLFPIHSQDHNEEGEEIQQEELKDQQEINSSNVDHHHHYYAAASLELTLNSYYYAPPGST